MFDEDVQRSLQREQTRLAVDQRQHVDGEGGLERRVLEQTVERLARRAAALQFDDDAHPLAVGLVAQVADLVQPALARQFGDAFQQVGLVELVGYLRDHDLEAAARFLDLGDGAHLDVAAAGGVGRANAV